MASNQKPFLVEDRKIRFALVGCGRISKNHFEALAKHKESAELVAICDNDPTALSSAVKAQGVPGFADLTSMLEQSKADIVVLTTPSGLHSSQAIEVAKKGWHVLTEKPMATNLEDGHRMQKACKEAQVHLFVVHQNRRNATLQLLKRAIDQNRFGKIYLVNVNVFWTRPQSYYDQSPWRGTWKMDGGAFINQASHYVDLLSWLMGPVESLFSFTSTLARKIEAEDSGVVSLRWKSGAMGSMNVTMLTYPENLEGSITILGERGTAVVGGVAVNEIKQWRFSSPVEPDDAQVSAASYPTASVYGFGHSLYYENVIQTLQGKAQPYTDGLEGLKSLELLEAIYRSSRSGKPLTLPLGV